MKQLLIFALFCLPLFGQNIKIIEPIQKIPTYSSGYSFARISPDGQVIAVSEANYKGIFLIDISGGNKKTLTTNEGAGWNFAWSPTSQYIAARLNYWSGNSKESNIAVFDRYGKLVQESERENSVGLPFWSITGANVAYFDSKEKINSLRFTEGNDPAYVIHKNAIDLSYYGRVACFNATPFAYPGEVLNIALSPDKSKMAVEVAQKGILIYDCAMNSLYDLGQGEFPCWVNSEYLVYARTKDNGERIVSSDIILRKFNGDYEMNLTMKFDGVALYPSTSNNGRIVFLTDSGELYSFVVTIN
jgi:Tol biopolymer transport system component